MGIICSLPEEIDDGEVSEGSGVEVGPDAVKDVVEGRVDGDDVVEGDNVVVGGESTVYGNTRP